MVTYTEPANKSWVMDSYEDFAEGTPNGTELENPNYTGKVVLECKLGTNKLGPTEKDWNPSFEDKHPFLERPEHWRFEEPSTGSTYVQGDPEEAYEGDDFVKLADEGEQGRIIQKVGRLNLDPENVSPNALQIDADPEKTFTIRYHGRYENPEEIRNRGPKVNMAVKEDETTENVFFEPFSEEEEYPIGWKGSDFRLRPSDGTPENRWIDSLKLNFGDTHNGKLGELNNQRWCLDAVSIAETFPANAAFFASGTYTSPTLYTPPTVSKVAWGQFAAVTSKPSGTDIQFELRGYDWQERTWSPWLPINPGENISLVVGNELSGDLGAAANWTRLQWRAKLTSAPLSPELTPEIDSVTVHYTEAFRTDHPRIWLESDDIAGINAKIDDENYAESTLVEYNNLKTKAAEAKETPEEVPTNPNQVDSFLSKYRSIVAGASFVYLLGREGDGDDYAAGAATWVEYLLANAPFFLETDPPELNTFMYGGNVIERSNRQHKLAWTLALFRDWCHAYLTDPENGLEELLADVEETLLQLSYFSRYRMEGSAYTPSNRFRGAYTCMVLPLWAVWDTPDVYEATYRVLPNWPLKDPRVLMEGAEAAHVDGHFKYYETYFPDGTDPEGGGYGSGHVTWMGRLYKAWATAFHENWFSRAPFVKEAAVHLLHRLHPNCTWEKMSAADGRGELYSSTASPRFAIIGSEFDGGGDIGPVLRYITESILMWYPPANCSAFDLIMRVLWRDSQGTATDPAAAGLPTAKLHPNRGEAFARTKWEFDPAGQYTNNEFYYGIPRGTAQEAVYVAFKSGPALTGHNHADQNCFTIFARGHLAVDSGVSDGTPSTHHNNYFGRTIAHNAVLIYDPNEEYPHSGQGQEEALAELSNDGGQIFYFLEDDLLRGLVVDYNFFFKHKRTNEAGRIERFETRAEYDYMMGVATTAYNAYDYLDQPVYEKAWHARREIVLAKAFDEHVPTSGCPHFVVVYDEVIAHLSAVGPYNKTQWVIHAVEKPAVKTAMGWQTPGDATAGWEPGGELGVFRLDAWEDQGENTEYDGRLFGVTLLPGDGERTLSVVGGQSGEEDYRYLVENTNYPPSVEQHATDGSWRLEITTPGTEPSPKFLHVLWPATKTEAEPITCDLVTEAEGFPEFAGAFIRPQEGENGGTLHHVVGFAAEADTVAWAYDLNLESHTNHVLCHFLPLISYKITVKNLATLETEEYQIQASEAGVIRFEGDPVSEAGPHRVTVEPLEG